MFKNLLFECEKNNIKITDAASILNISVNSFKEKLKGKRDFKISECLKLQKIIGDGNICLEYLFQEKN